MKGRDILLGFGVLALIAGVVYYRQKNQTVTPVISETPSTEQKLEDKFNIEIPDNADKAELTDVSGGTGSGIVTKVFDAGKFKSSVIADLPEPAAGETYQVWLSKGEEGATDFSRIS